MFEYKQPAANKRLTIIFVALFVSLSVLLMLVSIKTLVTVLFISLTVVAYIAYVKYRHNETTLTGEKLIKPDWHDSVNRVNLKVTIKEADRATMMQELAYKIISQSHDDWK